MPILQIEYLVPDFDVWKKIFSTDDARRRKSGVRRYRILRPIDDLNRPIIDLEFDSMRQAEDFLAGLRNIWERVNGTLLETPRARIAIAADSQELAPLSPEKNTSENLTIVRRVYEGFERGDFGIIARYFDPEVEIYQTPLLPWGGYYQGHEGVTAFFTKLLANLESRVEIGQLIDAGDHVVETGRTRGRSKQSGETFDVAEVHVWRLTNSKVVEFRAYIDTPAMAAALSIEALG